MFKYITIALVELFAGLIGLSAKQAARRPAALKKIEDQDGVYEIVAPIQFKVGEVIGLEKPDKVTLSKVEPTPETIKALADLEAERIDLLADAKAKEIRDKKCMEDLVVAAEQAVEKGLVTQSGLPTVEAMEEILGQDITADQRDAAWEILQQESGE